MVIEGLFAIGRPDFLGDEVLCPEPFAAAPDAGGGVEGQCFLMGLAAACLAFASGSDEAGVAVDGDLLEFPDLSMPAAMAGFVVEE